MNLLMDLPALYRGSVKNVLGPIQVGDTPSVVFQYTDAYSVFDWGKMPDSLLQKGEAMAILSAYWFEKLESPELWREFSKSKEALGLRKGNRIGSIFNEIGEELQKQGLKTHYLGVLPTFSKKPSSVDSPVSGDPASSGSSQGRKAFHEKICQEKICKLSDLKEPIRNFVVKQVAVVKPNFATVLGRTLPDYQPTRNAPMPRLIPLEVVFRWSCPKGSSLLERVARDPEYLASLGFQGSVESGGPWDFPILELFTKLETTDRVLSFQEAMAISGLNTTQFQELLIKTAWIAGVLRWLCGSRGLELADGKLEWGLSEKGECFLVDAIGPDELRLLKNGVQLSKEFLRVHYRDTSWYEVIQKAKASAKTQGSVEWKKMVPVGPNALPDKIKECATHLFPALTNTLTDGLAGRAWFPKAWSLDKVVQAIEQLK